MCCLRSFSILDLLLGFEVHTDESIAAGREEIRTFGNFLKVCKYFSDSMFLTLPGLYSNIYRHVKYTWREREGLELHPSCMP